MAKMRFVNKTKTLQLVYDEHGNKREIVPGGTVRLEEKWGKRFGGVLAPVPKTPKTTKSAKTAEKSN